VSGSHQPVLLSEVVDALNIKADGIYIDATFGRGGHAAAILSRLGQAGRLLVLDKDPEAIASAKKQFGNDSRVQYFQESYANLKDCMVRAGLVSGVDGVLMDLGVSSPQLDNASRGFSFRKDGPLDMRMNPDEGESAAQWLSYASFEKIVRVIREYGEEKFAKRVAGAICEYRQNAALTTTQQLADLITQAMPVKEKRIHPATRTFQAIRIYVNQELSDLQRCLEDLCQVLGSGGRLAVISFHSLEDRLVKRTIREYAKGDNFPSGVPVTQAQLNPLMSPVGKAIFAGDVEVRDNPRARSAVLRVAVRL
jgi:16S rRNA (cytosine1402-N4)-methyltransferase